MKQSQYKFGVIKVGSEVVTDSETGHLDEVSIRRIVKQVNVIRRFVDRICIVTSGAVAAGRAEINGLLDVTRENETPADKQVYSAAGQPVLHNMYEKYLRTLDLRALQILLTKGDYDRKEFRSLFQRGLAHPSIIPIINENDALTDSEIRFGDNDRLAKDIASRFRADIFVSLTSKNGVLQRLDNDDSNLQIIQPGSREWEAFVDRDTTTKNGSGDMWSKCDVHSEAADEGIEAGIIDGREKGALVQFVRNKPPDRPGTTFLPK